MKSLLVSLKALDLFQAKSANLTIALQKEMDKKKSAPLVARFVASVFINDQFSLSPLYYFRPIAEQERTGTSAVIRDKRSVGAAAATLGIISSIVAAGYTL